MTDSVTFWARPTGSAGYGPAPVRPRHGRVLAASGALALGCVVGTVLIVRYIAALDWDHYAAWDRSAHRVLASTILLSVALALGAVALVYAGVRSGRGWIRDNANARRCDRDAGAQVRLAALTLSPEGFKHWSARPTRALVPWTEVASWTATRDEISITLTERRHASQVVTIPFAEINAKRQQVTTAFERLSGQPPSGSSSHSVGTETTR